MKSTNLEQLRENYDLTKKELAEKLNISDSVYSRWESGKDVIPTKRLYQIANYYQTNIDYILKLTNKKVKIISSNEIDIELYASRIKEIRKDFNETLKEISSRFKISISSWSAYENGSFIMLCIFLIEVCKQTNYSADWILGRTNKKYRD